jgi:hypothetical protein
MAYKSDTIDTVVKTIKTSEKTEVRVTQIAGKNGVVQAVDIRQWYCTESDPTMKPTQKGVRVKDTQCPELLDAIIKACSSEALMDLNALNPAIDIDIDNL